MGNPNGFQIDVNLIVPKRSATKIAEMDAVLPIRYGGREEVVVFKDLTDEGKRYKLEKDTIVSPFPAQ